MKSVNAFNRLLDRVQARFRRARSGSVLILVVALLVLMALLGTAFISTARIDRYSAVINSANTEIDLLVQGIINMALGNVVDDLYDPTPNAAFGGARDYRKPPADGPAVTGAYEHHDNPGLDFFLASRLPEVLNLLEPVSVTNPPTWHGVTWPLVPRADGTYWFDRPGLSSLQLTLAKNNYAFSPTFVTTGTQTWPALQIWTRGAGGTWTSGGILRAADADGDGFADAGLWKIPVGTIDGITYYAAARIIDNNSAINVNTALSRDMDFNDADDGINSALFFPSRVGLGEMVKTYNPTATNFATFAGPNTEMFRMNAFRFNNVLPALTTPVRDDGTAPTPGFDYASLGDALHSQIARRIKFPGRNTAGPAGLPFQTYGIGESMTLAYRGGLRNPNVSPSLLEQHLEESLVTGVPVPDQYAQNAAAVLAWFTDLYNYDLELPVAAPTPSTFRPLRALLVASNPVANQALATYDLADLNGDGLRNDLPAGLAPAMAPYVTAPTQQANPPKVSINTASFQDLYRGFWNVMVDEVEDPVGTFRKAAPVEETLLLFDTVAGNRDARMDPYYGQRFDPLPPYASIPAEQNPARMFRSPLRDTRVPAAGPGSVNRMLPYDVLKLRAGIAAVNAIDLRDSDNDVTEQSITVNVIQDNTNDTVPPPAVTTARVYGTEAQPFITEVYANLHNGPTANGINPNGYVAIELSNPYPFDIPLRIAGSAGGWSVGLIDRNPLPVKTQLTIVPIDPVAAAANPVWDFPEGTVVPAATAAAGPGKLVLENYAPVGGDATAATYRPELVVAGGLPVTGAVTSPTVRTVYVSQLHRVFASVPAGLQTGGEFVLLRTRAGDSTAVTGPDLDANGSADYDELLRLHDLIPVDSFDFSGMSKDFLSLAPPYLWMHYVRENGRLGALEFDWRFVYPGRYDASANAATPTNTNARHQGVQMILFGEPAGPAPTELDILVQKRVALGAVDPLAPGAGHYTNPFTIQLANTDFGGHNKIGAAGAPTPPQFPFGAFARNGDILQVPFIGAYVIDSPDAGAGLDAFLEMNSVSMDSVFAEDTDTANDPVITGTLDTGVQDREQIGRFYPIARNVNQAPFPAVPQTADFIDGIASANAPTTYNLPGEYWNFTQTGDNPLLPTTYVPQWRYRWAMDLFEHLTVEAPHDDYFPNIAKTTFGTVQPVSNSGGTAGDSTVVAVKEVEHREPVEGLININTASWKVLSALPLVLSNGPGTPVTTNSGPAPGTVGQVFPGMTRELAKVIVYYRDVDADPFTTGNQPHGPFRTIMELNKVVDTRPAAMGGPADPTMELNLRPGFRNAMGTLVFTGTSATDINDPQGDFSPLTPAAADGVRADFEEKSLALSRISNLVTTRSDSFTCYLLVQGYRDAETANPELVVQRRVAFLLDRSGTVPAFSQPLVTKTPNN